MGHSPKNSTCHFVFPAIPTCPQVRVRLHSPTRSLKLAEGPGTRKPVLGFAPHLVLSSRQTETSSSALCLKPLSPLSLALSVPSRTLPSREEPALAQGPQINQPFVKSWLLLTPPCQRAGPASRTPDSSLLHSTALPPPLGPRALPPVPQSTSPSTRRVPTHMYVTSNLGLQLDSPRTAGVCPPSS